MTASDSHNSVLNFQHSIVSVYMFAVQMHFICSDTRLSDAHIQFSCMFKLYQLAHYIHSEK